VQKKLSDHSAACVKEDFFGIAKAGILVSNPQFIWRADRGKDERIS
jgi:hypothetical protein